MQLHKPDPDFISSPRAKSNFAMAARFAIGVTAFIWFVWLSNSYLDLNLNRYGLRPRDLGGLIGVLTAPFLHANLEHIFSNTLPLLISLTALLYLYPNSALRVIPMVWIGAGLLAWCIGSKGIHIGASGFVYGVLAFVFLSGLYRQDMRSVGVSLMVWFMYGSMIWGVLPIRVGMSWEFHLSGAILGVIMAFLYRSYDRVPIKTYDWEEDDSVPEWFPQTHSGSEDAQFEDENKS